MNTPPSPEQAKPAGNAGQAAATGPLPMKSTKSLTRLRDRVARAVQEIDRLRDENAALARRIAELEQRKTVPAEGTTLTLDADAATVREQVEGFIAAIDRYLDAGNTPDETAS